MPCPSPRFLSLSSFTDIDDTGKPVDKKKLYPDINERVDTYEVKLITYSPLTGGEPVGMNKQFG